ncbi:spore coat U domain-containing protein [Kluyvera sp. STS39-E]|uniref:spore coat U domain-containing protein n=1 Tax=Kluyvera sp. STS39-E TaxID=3234748 RepID=UPI0034C630C3
MKRVNIIIFCFLSTLYSAAQADGSATATMHVTLEVLKSCTLQANDLNFASHGSDESSEINATAQLSVLCTNGTPYTLSAASSDSETDGTFWLKPEDSTTGAQTIAYKLYADESQATPVNASGGIEGTGTGEAQSETIYGVIKAGALTKAKAGLYSDNVTLNLVY